MSSILYILAEERSGSTWVHKELASKLCRKPAYIEIDRDEQLNRRRLEIIKNNQDKYSDTSKVYRTHIFPIVDVLKSSRDPLVLIRTSRHNHLEQMLSYFLQAKALEKAPVWVQMLPTYRIDDVLTDKITLTEAEVTGYITTKKMRDGYWATTKGQTIYYEDLFEGVEVKDLGITLKFDKVQRTQTKNPIASYFENYEEIKRLVQ
jgi:hypothetical protein